MLTYTINQIQSAWKEFSSKQAFCVLKQGKWENTPMLSGFVKPEMGQATSAKTRPLKDVMDFPDYLDKYYKVT